MKRKNFDRINQPFCMASLTELLKRLNRDTSRNTSMSQLVAFIKEYGQLAEDILNDTEDLEETEKMINELYAGTYENEVAFMQDFMTHEIPEHIIIYVNYEKMAKDYFAHSFSSIDSIHGEIHVFYRE